MELSRNSRLVRWAYWKEGKSIPDRTSLCVIVWRSVLWTPLKLSVVGVYASLVIFAMLLYLQKAVQYPITTTAVLVVCSEVFVIAWSIYQWRQLLNARAPCAREPSAPAVLWQGVKAIKQQICPIVELK